ncbi:General stress protein 69 [Roseivivax sp. THAF40]|uniref:aldo/keto reductase n=1 Tax=unclassified Roseivivax TaxID=2639302 RepID=UPI00126893C9|nr:MULTISPECIES: aldo/keto reductase [unclassified Roseivivax]QFS83559.1 General stress protein 69 [Roseivivax sp. THAF197b]QFT47304.1 General stress protein 69 [Roseivivax sp. THAF40]
MSRVATTDLRPDHRISRVIRGGWQLAGDHGAVDRSAAIADMEAFVDAGITTFDCADIYTGVEEMIGAFIADLRRRRGPQASDRVVVHTKLVPDLGRLPDLRADEVEAIIDRSLKRLNVERLDLVQFYWWDTSLGDPVSAMEVLKRCQSAGKIRNLGVTNWDVADTRPFVEAGIDLVSTQVQYSVLDRRAAGGLAEWAADVDMQLLCYGTLAGGFLTDAWLGKPDPGFAFENRSLVKYRLIIDEFGPWPLFQELLETLHAVGERHGASLSSVATAWVLDQPNVAAAIVGARYARHLPKTLQVFDVDLTAEDHAEIGAVIAKSAGPNGPVFGLEGDRTSRHGRIMKYNLNTNPADAVLGSTT